MIEEKLKIAANKLPAPQSTFEDVIQRATQDTKQPNLRERISDWNMRKLWFLCIIAFCLVLSLFGCQVGTSYTGGIELSLEEPEPICGAMSSMVENGSVHEAGVFYVSGQNLLCYYDYDSEEAYILCSDINCKHKEDTCIAKVEGLVRGYAMYGNRIYYLTRASNALQWEFYCMDIQNQNRTKLAQLGSDGTNADSWILSEIGDVFYYKGKAWLALNYSQLIGSETGVINRQGYQLLAIDLETGEQFPITEICSGETTLGLSFNCFGETYMAYHCNKLLIPYMTKEQYAAYLGKETVTPEEYATFLEQVDAESNRHSSTVLVRYETMEQCVFSEGTNEDTVYLLYWEQNSKFVTMWEEDNGDDIYSYLDLDTKMLEPFWEITNGGTVSWYGGGTPVRLYNGDSILYLQYQEEKGTGKSNVYRYFLETGESEFLFEDEWYISFRIVGQTSDKLIGKVDESSQYAWIYKSDYENGDFSKLKKFTLR